MREFRRFLLLWLWPRLDDLQIRTWPVFYGDADKNFKAFESLTNRQTDRQTRPKLYTTLLRGWSTILTYILVYIYEIISFYIIHIQWAWPPPLRMARLSWPGWLTNMKSSKRHVRFMRILNILHAVHRYSAANIEQTESPDSGLGLVRCKLRLAYTITSLYHIAAL